ncbi:MAG: hypothetical protein ACKOB7_07765 [Methylocystis sp.]
MFELHQEDSIQASSVEVLLLNKPQSEASKAFVAAMDNLIDGLRDIETQFLAKAAERSEKLEADMIKPVSLH